MKVGNRVPDTGHREEQRGLKNFWDMDVWKKSHQLGLRIYRATRDFPSEERFGLTSQIRRAVISVPANIAEGFRKRGRKDKVNYYNIAHGSLEEVRYYLLLAKDLSYLSDVREEWGLAEDVSKMLMALRKSLSS
jgi:four helix bundle protein